MITADSLHIVKPQNGNKDTQMKQALVFSKPKTCKKAIEFKGQKLSQKVIARILMLEMIMELHLTKIKSSELGLNYYPFKS